MTEMNNAQKLRSAQYVPKNGLRVSVSDGQLSHTLPQTYGPPSVP